jgi:hypothetical protein
MHGSTAPLDAAVVTDDLTVLEAEQLTADIALSIEHVHALILRAYEGRAWIALGYATWSEYVDARFPVRSRTLPRQERMELVMELRERGLSTRAIAPVVGADQATVVRDIAATDASASVDNVVSLDGRRRPARRDPTPFEPVEGIEDARLQRANRTVTEWVPTAHDFNEQFVRRIMRQAMLTTGQARIDTWNVLRALQGNINTVLDTRTVPREEQSAEAFAALAALRWHWTMNESNPERVSCAAYAEAVGDDETRIREQAQYHKELLYVRGRSNAAETAR